MTPINTVVYTVPKLVGNRGTLPIKMRFKSGVGLIRVASGTKDPKTYLEIRNAMTAAFNVGNLSTLEAIRDKVITPLEFLNSVRMNGANMVLTIDTSVPIEATVSNWLEKNTDIKESTRRGYRSHLAGFFKHCKPTDPLKSIANRLESYREICEKKTIHVSFNHCRTALLAFGRSKYKRKSQVYIDLYNVEALPVIRKLYNDAVPVSDFITFTKAMNDTHAEIAWGLAYTGMRIGEFIGRDATWNVLGDRIELTKLNPGKANKGKNRLIMLPFPVAQSARQEKAIRTAFKTAAKQTGLTITPHTARKCFAYWASEAGIADVRIEAYERRGVQSMLNRYKRHEVDVHLAEDARRFRDYVESFRNPPPPPKRTITVMENTGLGMRSVEVEIPDGWTP
jgi:integrase